MRSARNIIAAAGVLVVLWCAMAPAHADALDDARRAGLVGETVNGYVAPVRSATPTITKLVNEINARRRAEYEAIAQKHGTSLREVEQLVGKRLIERAPGGTYVMDSTGQWKQK